MPTPLESPCHMRDSCPFPRFILCSFSIFEWNPQISYEYLYFFLALPPPAAAPPLLVNTHTCTHISKIIAKILRPDIRCFSRVGKSGRASERLESERERRSELRKKRTRARVRKIERERATDRERTSERERGKARKRERERERELKTERGREHASKQGREREQERTRAIELVWFSERYRERG